MTLYELLVLNLMIKLNINYYNEFDQPYIAFHNLPFNDPVWNYASKP